MFINQTGIIGSIIIHATNNITGSLFLTFFLLFLLLISFFMMFRMPFEVGFVLTLPLLLVIMAYSGSFVVVGGLILILLGLIFAKNLFLE